ncbi:hypothetical protein ANO14919_132810 [Xylariales sp. No.14919]|nr:hypothetical protein ANO14919_132810 [Xylariales sp. No.14919]
MTAFLSNITAPPFFLSLTSVIEIPASWASQHNLFLQPAHEAREADRVLPVPGKFLCGMDRRNVGDEPKKPLNASPGELFIGDFCGVDADGDSATRLVAEQVSHHSPVTASAMYNPVYGILLTGYVAQETTFHLVSGCVGGARNSARPELASVRDSGNLFEVTTEHVWWPVVLFHAAPRSPESELLVGAIPDPEVRELAA